MNTKAQEIIKRLNMQILPQEGGYFAFIDKFGDGAGTIYYLIKEDSFSHLHILSADEVWYFLEGDELEQLLIDENNNISLAKLDINNRVSIIKKNIFQATYIKRVQEGYALVCTTMSPAYKDEMYTHGLNSDRLVNLAKSNSLVQKAL